MLKILAMSGMTTTLNPKPSGSGLWATKPQESVVHYLTHEVGITNPAKH